MNTNSNKHTPNDKIAFDSYADSTVAAVHGANATRAGLQTEALQKAMDQFAQSLNESAIAKSTGLPVRTPSASYKGFAAEESIKQSLKINALAKGIPDWQLGAYTKGILPDGTTLSGIDQQVDITVFTRDHPWSPPTRAIDYQVKIHNNSTDYFKDMRNPQYRNVNFVGGAGQGVNDTVQVRIGRKTTTSDPITTAEAIKLADDMKQQNTPQYQHSAQKMAELNQIKLSQAVTFGAATNAILTTVREIVLVIKNRDDLPEDQWIRSIQHILCGAAEGGIRGGAIAGAVQLFGKALGREITENSFGAVPVMAIANTAVDFAKDLYQVFVTHRLDADDLLCNTVNHTFSSFAGFGGAWAGAQLAGSYLSFQSAAAIGASIGSAAGPLGTIIGSVVGGLIIGFGASLIINTATGDAQKAFNQCIADIQEKTAHSGCDTLYYYADAMSELSDFRLSFKNLLPCYNLISDLKEYNLRKKAIQHIHKQLDNQRKGIDDAKRLALSQLEQQHAMRLKELESCFRTQRKAMHDEFKDSMQTYISNAYTQYLRTFNVSHYQISLINEQMMQEAALHNTLLAALRHRNIANAQLNETLNELMEDPDSAHFVGPFVHRLDREMQNEELTASMQYLSFEEALAMQEVS